MDRNGLVLSDQRDAVCPLSDEKRHRGARGGGDGADETRTK